MVDDKKMTILHYAAKFRDVGTMWILEVAEISGPDPEWRDKDYRTALETFDDLRPMCMLECSDTFVRSRAQFQTILAKITKARYADSPTRSGAGEICRRSELAEDLSLQYLISPMPSPKHLVSQCGSLSRESTR